MSTPLHSAPLPPHSARARRFARFDHPVLIHGETGSGKELVARELHDASPVRSGGCFVALNCGAINPGTARSALFGHRRGAFTGADRPRPGALRTAHRGTLFLDEVAELSAELQAALLRVLEEGCVHPVGADREEAVDVRLVAATHRNLLEEVAAGRFRRDLYYRIAVLHLRVPSLRDRTEEIVHIAQSILAKLGRFELDSSAKDRLRAYNWPGNVRELRNVLCRATVALDGRLSIRAEDLEFDGAAVLPLTIRRYGVSDEEICSALAATRGNRTAAARRLGISRSTLYARLESLAA